jgi:hypothetical protein
MSQPGQWFLDKVAHRLYLWAQSADAPSGHLYELKQRSLGFDLAGRSNVTISGFDLLASTIRTDDNSTNDVLAYLSVRYVSHYDTIPVGPRFWDIGGTIIFTSHLLDTGIVLQGSRNVLRDSSITYSAGNGVSVQGDYNTVTDNLIRETDYMGTYNAGIYVQGTGQVVTWNTIIDTGRDGLATYSFYDAEFLNNELSHNNILNAALLSQDAGAIIACCNIDGSGTSIDHNWTHDLQAKTSRGSAAAFTGAGLYLDTDDHNFLVHHNVSWNNAGSGLVLEGFQVGLSRNNFVYNNTIGGGQVRSVTGIVFEASGTRIINNIFRGLVYSRAIGPGAYLASNLTSEVVPRFQDPEHDDWRLSPGSPGIGAGQSIPDIAGGPHPDVGAYQSGEPRWIAGCVLPGCTLFTIDDTSVGPSDAFEFSGQGWKHCTRCDLSRSGIFDFAGSYSSDQTAGDRSSVAFSGVGIVLYAMVGPDQGFATLSVDGGPQELVDFYQPSAAGDVQVYASPTLAPGLHTLTFTVAGSHDSSSNGSLVSPDRVDVIR